MDLSTVAPSTALPTTAPVVEGGLLLPPAGVVPDAAQHHPPEPHATRALVRAPDGTTFSIDQRFNSFGAPTTEIDALATAWDRRELAGTTWTGAPQGDVFTYYTLDSCRMLVINGGPTTPTGWDPAVDPLLASVDFSEPTTIDLPDGWTLIASDVVGDRYDLVFDPGVPGVSSVFLRQSTSSNVGPLLASVPGVGIRPATVDGNPAWQTTKKDPSGRYYTAWNRGGGAVMVGTNQELGTTEVAQVLDQLVPMPPAEWDARYQDIDAGLQVTRVEPTCPPSALTIT